MSVFFNCSQTSTAYNSIASTFSNSKQVITIIAVAAITTAVAGFTSVLGSSTFAHAVCLSSSITGALTCVGVVCGGFLVLGVLVLMVKAHCLRQKVKTEASSQSLPSITATAPPAPATAHLVPATAPPASATVQPAPAPAPLAPPTAPPAPAIAFPASGEMSSVSLAIDALPAVPQPSAGSALAIAQSSSSRPSVPPALLSAPTSELVNNLYCQIISQPNVYQLSSVTVEDHTAGTLEIEEEIQYHNQNDTILFGNNAYWELDKARKQVIVHRFHLFVNGKEGRGQVRTNRGGHIYIHKGASIKIMQVMNQPDTLVLKIAKNIFYIKTHKMERIVQWVDTGKVYYAHGGVPHENYASDPDIKLKALECASLVFEDEPASKCIRYEVGYNQFYVYVGTDRGQYAVSHHQSMLVYSTVLPRYFSISKENDTICTKTVERNYRMTWITAREADAVLEEYRAKNLNTLTPLHDVVQKIVVSYLFCNTAHLQVYDKKSDARIQPFLPRKEG